MNSDLSYDEIELNATNSNLERGRFLYQNGNVKDFRIVNEDFVLAKVKGNKTYKVFLESVDDTYIAYCNCPYEPKGQCKHQVAVKYTLMNIQRGKIAKTDNSLKKSFSKAYNYLLKYSLKLRYKFL